MVWKSAIIPPCISSLFQRMDSAQAEKQEKTADEARRLVCHLRRRAANGQYFVPSVELKNVLTRELVVGALDHDEIPEHRRHHTATKIVEDGIRTFAILLLVQQEHLVSHFIECDELDSKLPLSANQVQRISPFVSDRFHIEIQWEFIPYFFQRGMHHRKLRDEIILPYIHEERLAEGAGGEIFRCSISANQHMFDPDIKVCFASLYRNSTQDLKGNRSPR